MTTFRRTLITAASTALVGLSMPLFAQTAARVELPGQKLDSGLGDLPHYRYWADPTGKAPVQVAGQKLDSGLGDLPHYRLWADPTGKMPVPPNDVLALAARPR